MGCYILLSHNTSFRLRVPTKLNIPWESGFAAPVNLYCSDCWFDCDFCSSDFSWLYFRASVVAVRWFRGVVVRTDRSSCSQTVQGCVGCAGGIVQSFGEDGQKHPSFWGTADPPCYPVTAQWWLTRSTATSTGTAGKQGCEWRGL